MTIYRLSALAMSAALALGPLAATAAPLDDAAPSKAVSYADLNLHTAQGRATLDKRIRLAVNAVCQPALDNATEASEGRRQWNKCRTETGARVRQQLAALPLYQQVALH